MTRYRQTSEMQMRSTCNNMQPHIASSKANYDAGTSPVEHRLKVNFDDKMALNRYGFSLSMSGPHYITCAQGSPDREILFLHSYEMVEWLRKRLSALAKNSNQLLEKTKWKCKD